MPVLSVGGNKGANIPVQNSDVHEYEKEELSTVDTLDPTWSEVVRKKKRSTCPSTSTSTTGSTSNRGTKISEKSRKFVKRTTLQTIRPMSINNIKS
jgi:hypothetical protein